MGVFKKGVASRNKKSREIAYIRHGKDRVRSLGSRNIWEFDDCTVIECSDSFEVVVTRNGVYGHQNIVPADKEFNACREALDEALAEGFSPLYIWEDGAGVTVGYGMKASRQDLATMIRNAEFQGGITGPVDIGDQFQYSLDSGERLYVYTDVSFGDDFDDYDVIDNAVSFAVVRKGEHIPDRWDNGILFEVE